jgi:plasmid stabilization system protein ParE
VSSYWLHPDAESELGDAAVFYATHASPAIARAFLAEFETVLELLLENPQRGPHGEGGLRLYHFNRFPYTVIYGDDAQADLQIFAIAHQSREPRYWGNRITTG